MTWKRTYIHIFTYSYTFITILTHFQLAEYVSLESIIQKSALGLIVNALSQGEKMMQPSQGVKKGATPTKRSVQNAYRWDNGSIETVAHKTKLPALCCVWTRAVRTRTVRQGIVNHSPKMQPRS